MARTGRGLHGASLSRRTLLLVSAGTFGGLLFTAVYLTEGVARPGYDGWAQAISALSLGPGGWLQQVNFIVFGALTLCAAFGWRQALRPGVSATLFPLLEAITGLSLIVAGFFSQDPDGYPAGAVATATSMHGAIHLTFSFVSITALAVGRFVLARRFAAEPAWRGWAAYSAITGVLTVVFIALFGATAGHAPAGLFERLSTGVNSLLSVLVVTRLLLQARAGAVVQRVPEAVT